MRPAASHTTIMQIDRLLVPWNQPNKYWMHVSHVRKSVCICSAVSSTTDATTENPNIICVSRPPGTHNKISLLVKSRGRHVAARSRTVHVRLKKPHLARTVCRRASWSAIFSSLLFMIITALELLKQLRLVLETGEGAHASPTPTGLYRMASVQCAWPGLASRPALCTRRLHLATS